MIRLAFTTEPEHERLAEPLAERGIDSVFVPTEERIHDLQSPGFPDVDVGFVYPQRTAEGGVVDACLDVPWVNDREALLRSRYKAECLSRLRAAGVETPATYLVSNPLNRRLLPEVYESLESPLVVKPNYATRGEGIVRLSDYDSLSGVVDYIDLLHRNPAVGDQSYLVQEFLPDAKDYRVMVVDYEYAGAVERVFPDEAERPTGRGDTVTSLADSDTNRTTDAGISVEGRWKRNVHRGAVARSVSLSTHTRRLAERAAKALGVPWLGVDLLVTDERAVVNETSARPTVDAPEKYEDGFYDRLAGLIRATADGER